MQFLSNVGNRAPLFEGIEPDSLETLLGCIGARYARFGKGGVMLREQCESDGIGLILEGCAQATRLDPSGKQLVLSWLDAGSVYGDVLSLSPAQKSPVTVTALDDVRALIIPFEGVLNRCEKACASHDRLLRNLLKIVSLKYFELLDRLSCLMRPSLREKLLFYLDGAANREGSLAFNIPFDRATLAEYLNAERSALSRELSAMKRDGLIDFYKNTFKLLR